MGALNYFKNHVVCFSLTRLKPNHPNDSWNWVSSQNGEIPSTGAVMKAQSLRPYHSTH
jgi:hypothetical protein